MAENVAEEMPIPSILKQLQTFDKSKLSKSETKIKTVDGRELLESHDSCGNFKAVVTNKGAYGFVPDIRLDLQVGEIMPGLLQGSQDVAAEWDLLKQHNVTHVLNIACYVRNYFPDRIKYLNLPLYDNPNFHIVPFFKPAIDFINEARDSGGCILVHCNAGVSRAATIVIAYLMKKEGMSFVDALNLVKSKRPASNPNEGFQYQLKKYEKSLKAGK